MNKKLIEWAESDSSCEIKEHGRIISYHDTSGGVEELEFIIARLREVYEVGGAVSSITIDPAVAKQEVLEFADIVNIYNKHFESLSGPLECAFEMYQSSLVFVHCDYAKEVWSDLRKANSKVTLDYYRAVLHECRNWSNSIEEGE